MQRNTKTPIFRLQEKMLSLPANEDGFLLVLTMVMLIVLTIIGIAATNLTRIELQIAGNDRVHKKTFYQADGGTEIGMRLAYDNAVCVQINGGFNADSTTPNVRTIGDIIVNDLDFSSPQTLASTVVADGNRHAVYYPDGLGTPSHTNLLFNVSTKITPGSGMQMVSGYEGLGTSAAGGGTHSKFDIYSQHFGDLNSQSVITIGWQMSTHIINSASTSDCRTAYTN